MPNFYKQDFNLTNSDSLMNNNQQLMTGNWQDQQTYYILPPQQQQQNYYHQQQQRSVIQSSHPDQADQVKFQIFTQPQLNIQPRQQLIYKDQKQNLNTFGGPQKIDQIPSLQFQSQRNHPSILNKDNNYSNPDMQPQVMTSFQNQYNNNLTNYQLKEQSNQQSNREQRELIDRQQLQTIKDEKGDNGLQSNFMLENRKLITEQCQLISNQDIFSHPNTQHGQRNPGNSDVKDHQQSKKFYNSDQKLNEDFCEIEQSHFIFDFSKYSQGLGAMKKAENQNLIFLDQGSFNTGITYKNILGSLSQNEIIRGTNINEESNNNLEHQLSKMEPIAAQHFSYQNMNNQPKGNILGGIQNSQQESALLAKSCNQQQYVYEEFPSNKNKLNDSHKTQKDLKNPQIIEKLRMNLEIIESYYQINEESNTQIQKSLNVIKQIIQNRCLKHLNRELRRVGLNVGNKCLYWACKIGMRRKDWISQRKKWQQSCHMCKSKVIQEQKSRVLRAEFLKNPDWSSQKIKELARILRLKVNQIYKWKWDNLEKINARQNRKQARQVPLPIFKIQKQTQSIRKSQGSKNEASTKDPIQQKQSKIFNRNIIVNFQQDIQNNELQHNSLCLNKQF
eukprot:403370466